MEQNLQADYDPAFPFSNDIFLPTTPMTDEEFAAFVIAKNDEIPIEQVEFNTDFQP